jgi:molybdopterin-binding protein
VKWIDLEHAFVFAQHAVVHQPRHPPGDWVASAASTALWPAGTRYARASPVPDPSWDSVGGQQSWSLTWESVMQLSARNQIPARVTSINAGEAIANVELSANGVRLVASVTVEAVRELGLAEGSNVTAVIKASDVILAIG